MLYYNWPRIYKASKGDILVCWSLFNMVYNKGVPQGKKDLAYPFRNTNFGGTNFLVAPEELLASESNRRIKDLVVYISLASKRNLADYLAFNEVTLDVLHITMRPEIYTNNNLLRIHKGRMHFLYEDKYMVKRKRRNGIIV